MPNFETADNRLNQLNENLKTLSAEDALVVKEEFRVLTKDILPQLMHKINLASSEVLETPEGQQKMDRLLDEFSKQQRYLENLKHHLLIGDINAIKAMRDERIDVNTSRDFVDDDAELKRQAKLN